MPINLVSGLPGHGKTLRTLQVVEKLRKESGRPVYYHHISELVLPWIKLEDPKKWMDLPDGSIVVIDEAHEVFPKRPPGSKPPEYVELLATHRHRGFDFWLITQHAQNQLDHFVRGLIEGHEHTVRLFGSQRSRIHRWNKLGKPGDYHSEKESVTEQWSFPREVYGWYKSAEVHTVQRKLPWKPIITIVGGIAAIGVCGWLAYATLFGNVEAGAGAVAAVDGATERVPVVKSGVAPEAFVPAVEGIPFSAPFYSPAVSVQQAPQIAGCGSIRVGNVTRCWCNTQQGTRVDVDKRTCINYVKAGNFRFDRGEDYYPRIEPYVPPLAPPMDYNNAGSSSSRFESLESESASDVS